MSRFLSEEGLKVFWKKIKDTFLEKNNTIVQEIETVINDTYLKKTDAANLYLSKASAEGRFEKNNYALLDGGKGKSGYIRIAVIKILDPWTDGLIEFSFSRRREKRTIVSLVFTNTSSIDPVIYYFASTGACNAVYIRKDAASTWSLFIQKIEPYDIITIYDVTLHQYIKNRVSVQLRNDFYASLPSDAGKVAT